MESLIKVTLAWGISWTICGCGDDAGVCTSDSPTIPGFVGMIRTCHGGMSNGMCLEIISLT